MSSLKYRAIKPSGTSKWFVEIKIVGSPKKSTIETDFGGNDRRFVSKEQAEQHIRTQLLPLKNTILGEWIL